MKYLLVLLLALPILSAYGSGVPVTQSHDRLMVEHLLLQTDSDGDFSQITDNLNGMLQAVVYINGNFTGESIVQLNSTYPYDTALGSYNISSGNYTNLTYESYSSGYPLIGPVKVSCMDCTANATGDVFILFR